MQAIIGSTLLSSKVVQPTNKPFEIYDSRLSGFTLRVQTLGMFIADTYTPWVQASRPLTAADTLEKLYRHFRTWYPEPLTAITVERVEAWKARRLSEGRRASTVVRDLFTLSSVLRRTVKAGELKENPVRRVDKPLVDRRGTVRFLDQAEESRLRDALKARDEEMRNRRTVANIRRLTRHERLLSPLMHFGDHDFPTENEKRGDSCDYPALTASRQLRGRSLTR